MILELGHRGRFDAAHRAVVCGLVVVGPDPGAVAGRAQELVAEGADVVELGAATDGRPADGGALVAATAAVRGRVDVPLVVATSDPALLGAVLEAGADAGRDPAGAGHPALLGTCADAGATFVAVAPAAPAGLPADRVAAVHGRLRELAAAAVVAGIAPQRLLVDDLPADADRALALALLHASPALSEWGHAAVSSFAAARPIATAAAGVDPADAGSPAAVAAHVLAVSGGRRFLRTTAPRPARRVADLVAAILGAGGDPTEGPRSAPAA